MKKVQAAASSAIQTITRSPRKVINLNIRKIGNSETITEGATGSDDVSLNSLSSYASIISHSQVQIKNNQKDEKLDWESSSDKKKYQRGKCKNNVDDEEEVVECEFCKMWYHIKCAHFSRQQYKAVSPLHYSML